MTCRFLQPVKNSKFNSNPKKKRTSEVEFSEVQIHNVKKSKNMASRYMRYFEYLFLKNKIHRQNQKAEPYNMVYLNGFVFEGKKSKCHKHRNRYNFLNNF